MKTVFAILFLCSVAVSQDAAVNQSSQPITVEQANILLQMRESSVHSMAMSDIGKKAHDQTVDEILSQFWHENCDHPVNASMAKACGQTTAEPTAVKPKAGVVPEPCGSGDSEKTKPQKGEASR
jgi:hypothetical protein